MTGRSDAARRTGWRWVAVLCVVAGIRVVGGALSFPVFNHLDEVYHFDRVLRAANGEWPRSAERLDHRSAAIAARFATWEYLTSPAVAQAAGEAMGPQELVVTPAGRAIIRRRTASWARQENRESFEPPGYYALTGWWTRLVGAGAAGGAFRIRLLGAPWFVLAVLAGIAAARAVYPGRPGAALGAGCLLAGFAHEVFYGINNDVPMPALIGWAWWALMAGADGHRVSAWRPVVGGLLLGGAVLTKGLAIPAAGALALLPAAIRFTRRRAAPGTAAAALLAPGLAVGVPALWSALAAGPGGGWLGYGAKAVWVGWTPRPAAAWADHPLWTLEGARVFLGDLMTSFWIGPLSWHGVLTRYAWLDGLAVVTTLAGLAAGIREVAGRPRAERAAPGAALAAILMTVASLAWVSIRYDSGMTGGGGWVMLSAGRYLLAVLVPVVVLCAGGLDALGRRLGAPQFGTAWCAGFGALMLAHEAAMIARVSPSAFNAWHLP